MSGALRIIAPRTPTRGRNPHAFTTLQCLRPASPPRTWSNLVARFVFSTMVGSPSVMKQALLKGVLALLLLSSRLRSTGSITWNVGTSNTRRLSENEDHWKTYQEQCGQVHVELYLSVGVHMYFHARPLPDSALTTLCQPIVLHAESSFENGKSKETFKLEAELLWYVCLAPPPALSIPRYMCAF